MEELNQQVVDGEGAAPAGAGAEPTSGEPTTEGTPTLNIEAQVNAAIEKVVEQYEGKGGHMAKLRSKLDSRIAELERELRERDQAKVQQALGLVDSDPKQAAQLLAGLAQEQAQAASKTIARQELVAWQKKIMGELGFNVDEDEEAATLAAQWTEPMLANQGMTYDFQQELARRALEREQKGRAAAEKQLGALQGSIPDLIKAEVTRALTEAGVTPAPEEGGAPQRNDNWRKSPSVSRGIAERRKRPINRA